MTSPSTIDGLQQFDEWYATTPAPILDDMLALIAGVLGPSSPNSVVPVVVDGKINDITLQFNNLGRFYENSILVRPVRTNRPLHPHR